jgi:molybdopterin-containing oxidoreductase family iron-sulfur binding subunit
VSVSRRELLAAGASAAVGVAVASAFDRLRPLSAQEEAQLTAPSQEAKRRWVWVIDLDRCNGCRKCTEACYAEMHVPPAWGEPEYQGRQPWIQVFDQGPEGFLVTPCQNCQDAPCAKVCPVGATYYSEDHIVLIDQDRCIGCRICMAACPYERRFFNWFDPPVSDNDSKAAYSPDTNIPHRRGVVEKCIWCRHRVKEGRVPACVEACTEAGMKALWFGDAAEDAVSDGQDVMALSSIIRGRGGYRLKDELGTKPSIIYLPLRGGVTQ